MPPVEPVSAFATLPHWVRTPEEVRLLAAALRGAVMIAVDSESDSLHHFPEKVCLIQIATPRGDVFLVDPLAVRDLSPLAEVFRDRRVAKVLHGAAYDLASMKRDFAFEIVGLFDTMVAAQFLGLREVGLSALLHGVLGIAAEASHQKDDWAARPLSPAQERYAAGDVRHLLALREYLMEALAVRGREAWVAEECHALEATPPAERIFEPGGYAQIKGARTLDRRGLAVLRELFVAREEWAHAAGKPPFKILGNDTLIGLALERPTTSEALSRLAGCTPTVVNRYGPGILRAVAAGLAVPQAALPLLHRPKKPRPAPAVAARIGALTAWRTAAAARLDLDPGLLLPRRLIEQVAEAAPADTVALAAIEGIRDWRVATLGAEILTVLNAANASTACPISEEPRERAARG